MQRPKSEADQLNALDHALHEAASMASLTTEFLGRALGFDDAENLAIGEHDRELLSFAVLQTKLAINRARDIFIGPEEGRS